MRKKIHLLVIAPFYPPLHTGGYELRCKDIVDSLANKDYQIKIISTHSLKKKNLSTKSEDILRVLHRKSQSHSFISQFIHDVIDLHFIQRMIRSFKPDLIYLSNLGDLSNAIIPYFSSIKTPIIYDEGGYGLVRTKQILERGLYFFRNNNDSHPKKLGKNIVSKLIGILSGNLIKVDASWPTNMHVLYNSQISKEYAEENGVPELNSKVIHSGIDLQKFQFSDRDTMNTPIKVVVPGRIARIKGTKDSVFLLKELLNRGIPAELTLIGKIIENDYFDEIQKLISIENLTKSVNHIPMIIQDDLVNFYRNADICFFPSYQKYGFSRVPLEAMACGTLVLTYGKEGSDEIIDQLENGIIAKDGDICSAVNLITEMMNKSKLYQRIIQNARQKIIEEYSMVIYTDAISKYLDSILDSN